MTTTHPTPLTIALTVQRHEDTYRDAAHQQRETALANLQADPPDYSAAATACHRALQFTRQAECLNGLARDAGLS